MEKILFEKDVKKYGIKAKEVYEVERNNDWLCVIHLHDKKNSTIVWKEETAKKYGQLWGVPQIDNKKLSKAWKYVEKFAKERGYECWSHNSVSQGAGATIYKDEDRFIPIMSLNIWWGEGVSIHVEDRNGNAILDGECCAVHILNSCKDFEDRLEKMCAYVFDKYSKYSRENRLDYVFNNLKEERIEWHKIEI